MDTTRDQEISNISQFADDDEIQNLNQSSSRFISHRSNSFNLQKGNNSKPQILRQSVNTINSEDLKERSFLTKEQTKILPKSIATPKFNNYEFLNRISAKAIRENQEKYDPMLSRLTFRELYGKKTKAKERWTNAIAKVILANKAIRLFKKLRFARFFSRDPSGMKSDVSLKKKQSILNPDSNWKIIWNLLMASLLIYTAVFVPYKIAFLEEWDLKIDILEYFVDLLFALDIVINFMSPFYDDQNNLVTDRKTICIKYLNSWFIFDLVSCFPFQAISSSNQSQYNSLARLFRLPRFYKLLRIVKLIKMVKNFGKNNIYIERILFQLIIRAGIVRLIQTIVTLLFFVHIFGCIWFLLARYHNFSPETWVVRFGLIDSSRGEQYLSSIYWVLQTLSTVGYGEIHPQLMSEKIFTSFLMIFGVGFYSFTVGGLTAILSNIDSKQQKLISKFVALNAYCKENKLPDEIELKMKRILESNHERPNVNESFILEEFPISLKAEVMTYAHARTFQKIKFLRNKDPSFILELISFLRPLVIEAGDTIYRKGDLVEEMYFIVSGRIKLVTSDGYIYKTYADGSFFGETEIMFRKEGRISTVLVDHKKSCEFLVIKKQDLLTILDKYPMYEKELRNVVKAREKRNLEGIKIAKKCNYVLSNERKSIIEKGMSPIFNLTARFGKKNEPQYPKSSNFRHSEEEDSNEENQESCPENEAKEVSRYDSTYNAVSQILHSIEDGSSKKIVSKKENEYLFNTIIHHTEPDADETTQNKTTNALETFKTIQPKKSQKGFISVDPKDPPIRTSNDKT